MKRDGWLRPTATGRILRLAALAIGALALVTFPYWSRDWESSRYATTVLRDILVFGILDARTDAHAELRAAVDQRDHRREHDAEADDE